MKRQIIGVSALASALNAPLQWTRRMLVRTKAGRKRGGRWHTTAELLLEHWEEAYSCWLTSGVVVADDDEDTGQQLCGPASSRDECETCDERRAVIDSRNARIKELEAKVFDLANRAARCRCGSRSGAQ